MSSNLTMKPELAREYSRRHWSDWRTRIDTIGNKHDCGDVNSVVMRRSQTSNGSCLTMKEQMQSVGMVSTCFGLNPGMSIAIKARSKDVLQASQQIARLDRAVITLMYEAHCDPLSIGYSSSEITGLASLTISGTISLISFVHVLISLWNPETSLVFRIKPPKAQRVCMPRPMTAVLVCQPRSSITMHRSCECFVVVVRRSQLLCDPRV